MNDTLFVLAKTVFFKRERIT